MRRIWIVSLAIMVAIAVIAALFAAIPARTEPKQEALSRYLAHRMESTGQPQRAARQVCAAHSGALDVSMSASTYGSGVYYRTTFDFASVPTPVPASAQTLQSDLGEPDGLRPLPFPPRELWCVWLEPSDGTHSPVVLVARHQDLYKAEWVVHEPLVVSGDASALPFAVGCNADE